MPANLHHDAVPLRQCSPCSFHRVSFGFILTARLPESWSTRSHCLTGTITASQGAKGKLVFVQIVTHKMNVHLDHGLIRYWVFLFSRQGRTRRYASSPTQRGYPLRYSQRYFPSRQGRRTYQKANAMKSDPGPP